MVFNIAITTAPSGNPSGSTVSATGTDQHIITDTERNTFKIQDSDLKDAVRQYFGKAPNDAYLSSPTPWNDLYKTYGWPQVQTLVSIQSATVTGSTTSSTALSEKVFTNNSSTPATFTADLTQSVTDTTETNWSQSNSVTVSQSVHYGIDIVGGETTFSYNYNWGQGGSQTNSVTVGDSSGVSVELQPGQSVIAKLTANRSKVTVRVVYNATLSGDTAINYNPTYQGHHFWALDINAVLNAAHKATTATITTDIEIGYYSNGTVTIVDAAKGNVLKEEKVKLSN